MRELQMISVNKFLTIFLFVVIAFSLVFLSSGKAGLCFAAPGDPGEAPEPASEGKIPILEKVINIVERLTVIIFWFISALVFFMLLIACYYLIISKGDPGKLAIAKKMFVYIAAGILVALLAKAFPSILRWFMN
ncbi:MAG: hypothetical protein ABIF89_02875 [bacterium]